MDNILFSDSDIEVAEITIQKGDKLDGVYLKDGMEQFVCISVVSICQFVNLIYNFGCKHVCCIKTICFHQFFSEYIF